MAARRAPKTRSDDPRVQQTREIVLQASLELLVNQGVDAVTAQSVHSRTGVARTTIYRHWPTPLDLLLDTLDRLTVPAHSPPLVGDLRQDLHALLTALKRRMERRKVRELVSATLRVALEDEAAHAAPRRFLDGLLAPIRDCLTSYAQQAGMGEHEMHRLYDRTVGPLVFRHVLMLEPVAPAQIEEVVTACAEALEGVERPR